jgi:hypothetical protein
MDLVGVAAAAKVPAHVWAGKKEAHSATSGKVTDPAT